MAINDAEQQALRREMQEAAEAMEAMFKRRLAEQAAADNSLPSLARERSESRGRARRGA